MVTGRQGYKFYQGSDKIIFSKHLKKKSRIVELPKYNGEEILMLCQLFSKIVHACSSLPPIYHPTRFIRRRIQVFLKIFPVQAIQKGRWCRCWPSRSNTYGFPCTPDISHLFLFLFLFLFPSYLLLRYIFFLIYHYVNKFPVQQYLLFYLRIIFQSYQQRIAEINWLSSA